jgi:crotonobetainyl-CoA:carnitine CoA-transferase CaiB-like acyl-CoA transferase
VLIESFRPEVAARIGLGPEAAGGAAVCVAISGFGQTGPHAERPGTDAVVQAFSGIAALNEGADGAPHKVGALVCDVVTGLSAFAAVQAALAERVLDAWLMQGMVGLLAFPIAEAAGYLGRTPAALNGPTRS